VVLSPGEDLFFCSKTAVLLFLSSGNTLVYCYFGGICMEIEKLEQQRENELKIIKEYEKQLWAIQEKEKPLQEGSEELEKLYVEDERLLQEVVKHLEVLDGMEFVGVCYLNPCD
jgi:hypothetical protein